MRKKLHFTATIHGRAGGDHVVNVLGREAWALLELVEAGRTGCTPIDNPAPRWSHYVWLLRGHGFTVETVDEPHAGPFAGSHARYVLHGDVTLEGGNLDEWRPNGVRYQSREGGSMKLGEIEVNGKSVAVFEPPHAEPDFPWVDVEQLAGAYLPRPEAKRIVRMTHKFGGEIRSYSTARNGDRVATIICHALAQGLCSTIDFKKGWKEPDEPGPVHREYCLALGRFAADNWHMSIEEIVHAYQNPGGVFLRGVL